MARRVNKVASTILSPGVSKGSDLLLNLVGKTEPCLKQDRADELFPVFEVAIHGRSAHARFEGDVCNPSGRDPVPCNAAGGYLEQPLARSRRFGPIPIPGLALPAARI